MVGYAAQYQNEYQNDPVEPQTWCMYFWIPTSLHMKKGKVAGQVAHAAARLARMMKLDEWEQYINFEVKIVYKVATVDNLFNVQNDFLMEYPVEHHTVVFDNTSETYTVLGIATKRDLKNSKWKLL